MKLGLIGEKLSHSFSKIYFENKFADNSLKDYSYRLFELASIDDLKPLIIKEKLDGFNVTIPYKQKIIPFLDEIDVTAKTVHAVNTVLVNWEEGKPYLMGFNTDVFGFEQMIKPYIKSHHERALILGTGGASKAVCYVLNKKGVDTLLVSRTKSEKTFTYDDINQNVLKHYPLIINTTPLGMYPLIDYSPQIPYRFLTPKHTLIDLVYNPNETLFLKKGKEQGTITLNGITMLHQQAEKAWKIWHKEVD